MPIQMPTPIVPLKTKDHLFLALDPLGLTKKSQYLLLQEYLSISLS